MSSTIVTTMTEITDVLSWEIQNLDKCLHMDGDSPGLIWRVADQLSILANSPEPQGIGAVRSPPMEVAKGSSLHSKWVFRLTSRDGHLALGVHLEDVLAEPSFSYNRDRNMTHILCAYDISLASGTGQGLFATAKKTRYPHKFNWILSHYGNEDRSKYYTYTDIMPIEDFLTQQADLCPENKLVVQIAFTVIFDEKHDQLSSLKVENIANKASKDSLAKSYSRMWTEDSFSKFSDFKVVCGDPAVTFHVNRAILAARSPFFETYFEDHWENTRTNQSEYRDEDCAPETLKALLKFIYAAELDIPKATEKEQILSLIYAAEKYRLTELKAACFYRMFTNITDENAGEFAVAAFNYKADEDCTKLIRNYCARRHEYLIRDTKYKDLFKSKPAAFLGD